MGCNSKSRAKNPAASVRFTLNSVAERSVIVVVVDVVTRVVDVVTRVVLVIDAELLGGNDDQLCTFPLIIKG